MINQVYLGRKCVALFVTYYTNNITLLSISPSPKWLNFGKDSVAIASNACADNTFISMHSYIIPNRSQQFA